MVLALTAQQTIGVPAWRSLAAAVIVLGLMGALAWLVSRGRLGFPGRRSSAITIESSSSLGERRLLVVITVDRRRLLLGVTTDHVSLITELAPVAGEPFATVLDSTSGRLPGGSS